MDLFFVYLLLGKTEKEYKKLIFKSTIISFLAALILFFPFFYLRAFLISLFVAIFTYIFFLVFPYLLKKHFIGNVDKELPYFLMDLDISLFLNVDFLDAIRYNSKKYKYLNIVFEKLFFNYLKGNTFQSSLFMVAEKIDFVPLKRALSQIIALYESGYKDKVLTDLAEEFLNKQKLDAKAYSSKLVMYSLFFIAATAILPAMYLMFVTVGSTVIEVNITSSQLLLLFFVVFPLVDILYILFVIYQMPYHLRESK